MEPRISCTDLLLRLGEDEVLAVDCRSADTRSWPALRIPGALRMTPEELALAGHVLPDDELIVLCGGGRNTADARRAWQALLQQGRYAVCLDGGLDAWVDAGYPVERSGQAFPALAEADSSRSHSSMPLLSESTAD